MTTEEPAKSPAEQLLTFWQNWMAAGTDAMMRTMSLLTPGTPVMAWTTLLREQVERGVQLAMETAKLPGAADLKRLSEEVSLLRAQMEAVSAGLAAMQAAFAAQQQGWKTLETIVQQTAAVQDEVKRTVEGWRTRWEEQVETTTRRMEEWGQRWEEMLRQGMAMTQASRQGLEELTRTMWDLARKLTGTG
jgi:uncharacterized protein YhaN